MFRLAPWFPLLFVTGCVFSDPPRTMYAGVGGRQVEIAFPVEKYRLANGLEVILNPDHHTPQVALQLAYRVGGADDPAGKPGLAHLYEHLMFDGSRHAPEAKFASYLDAAGATFFNAFTSADTTVYEEVVPSRQVELVLWLESDRLGFFDPVSREEVDRERKVVEMERRSRSDEAWLARIGEQLLATVYPEGHPYHNPVGGLPHSLDSVGPDDIAAFGATYYVPSNAALVLVGDFDVPSTKRSIERYFGPIPGAPQPAHRTAAPVRATAKRLVMEAPVATPEVVMGWPTPEFGTAEDADLDVLAAMLRDKLYDPLQKDRRVAQRWMAHEQSRRLESIFLLHAKAEPNVSGEALEHAVDRKARLGERHVGVLIPTRARSARGARSRRSRSSGDGVK